MIERETQKINGFMLGQSIVARVVSVSLIFFSISAQAPGGSGEEIVRPNLGPLQKNYLDVFPYHAIERPRVGLVLSGGGARGIAHLGVIEVLEEHNVPIDFIVGASMGSLIGGLYALGYSTESLRALVDTTDWTDVLSLGDGADRRDLFIDQKLSTRRGLFTLRFDGIAPVIPQAVTPAQRLSSFINQLVLQGIYHPRESFDDLRIPFRTVATDIITGERIIFDRGDLVQALRASISIPLLFSPVKKDDMLLVDGGLVSNIPVDVARLHGCDIIIAVNTTSGMRTPDQINAPWEIADQIVTIMQQRWNHDQLRLADIVITPPIDGYLGTDFDNMPLFLEEGRNSAQAAIHLIKQAIEYHYRSRYSSGVEMYVDPVIQHRGTFIDEISRREIDHLRVKPTVDRSLLVYTLNTVYESGWYTDVHASVKREESQTTITIHTEANPILREVTFIGNDNFDTDSLLVLFGTLMDKPANNQMLRSALEEVIQTYRRYGYSLATIDSTHFDGDTGALTVVINEGRIGSIVFEGNRKTRGYVVRREFPLRPGDVFRVDEAMRGIRNITGTGLFNQVLIDVKYAATGAELIINLDERHSELVRLSMRVDEYNHFQPVFELRNENLRGHGMEAGATAGGGLENGVVQADFIAHRIFNTYFSSRALAFYRFDNIPIYRDDPDTAPNRWRRIRDGGYRQVIWGGNISLGTQFERFGNVSVTFRLENHAIQPEEPGAVETERYDLVAYRFSSLFDTYDRFPFPEEGVSLHAYYESSLSFLGSDASYSKFYISYESYNTFFDRHTIRPRIQFGFGDETLPVSQQFFLGGKEMFYGLRQYDSRGRQIFLVNLEYRLKLPFRVLVDTYVHARYDIGSVWTTAEDIHLQDLRHGFGVGIGFDTPLFGPVQISVGKALRSRGDIIGHTVPSGPLQTYFSIGYPLP